MHRDREVSLEDTSGDWAVGRRAVQRLQVGGVGTDVALNAPFARRNAAIGPQRKLRVQFEDVGLPRRSTVITARAGSSRRYRRAARRTRGPRPLSRR